MACDSCVTLDEVTFDREFLENRVFNLEDELEASMQKAEFYRQLLEDLGFDQNHLRLLEGHPNAAQIIRTWSKET